MYRLLYSARFQSYSALPLAYSVPAGWESVGEYPSHQMAMAEMLRLKLLGVRS